MHEFLQHEATNEFPIILSRICYSTSLLLVPYTQPVPSHSRTLFWNVLICFLTSPHPSILNSKLTALKTTFLIVQRFKNAFKWLYTSSLCHISQQPFFISLCENKIPFCFPCLIVSLVTLRNLFSFTATSAAYSMCLAHNKDSTN